ncbi:MAG: Fic/DOC family protein [Erysipelotrichaceae bacterium]
MRDPYLYEDVDVLINLANIKDHEILRRAEADISSLAMLAIYHHPYHKFDMETLQDIHLGIFGQIYDWAGNFRTIQMIKSEDVIGGDSVRYSEPKHIKKELQLIMKEVNKLKLTDQNKEEVVFKLERIIAKIWQIHPFREGNTRTCIVFAVLLANALGFSVNNELFKRNSIYVRNALVWASQGMYARHEYLEAIFMDAILGDTTATNQEQVALNRNYEQLGNYHINDYIERPHQYVKEKNK